jgi:hypothetical protein
MLQLGTSCFFGSSPLQRCANPALGQSSKNRLQRRRPCINRAFTRSLEFSNQVLGGRCRLKLTRYPTIISALVPSPFPALAASVRRKLGFPVSVAVFEEDRNYGNWSRFVMVVGLPFSGCLYMA